jgi:metal-responsive CopG/Arc/MetJ family transcriptional regulator
MSRMIALRLDEALVKQVDRECRRGGLSRTEVVRRALELWIRSQSLEREIEREHAGYAKHPVAAEEFSSVLGAQGFLRVRL